MYRDFSEISKQAQIQVKEDFYIVKNATASTSAVSYVQIPLYTVFGKNGDHLPVNANDNLRVRIQFNDYATFWTANSTSTVLTPTMRVSVTDEGLPKSASTMAKASRVNYKSISTDTTQTI